MHAVGGLIYMDGAMNVMLGAARPGELGMDILHFNLHETFSVPHGGSGPGAGAIAVTPEVGPFLPAPVLRRRGDDFRYYHRPQSMGRGRAFHGNVNNAVRGNAYLRYLDGDGLAEVSRLAVVNANYVASTRSPPTAAGPGLAAVTGNPAAGHNPAGSEV